VRSIDISARVGGEADDVTAPAAVDEAKVDGHRGRWKLGEWIRPGHLVA